MRIRFSAALALLWGASVLWSGLAGAQCVPLTAVNTPVTQNFDGLASAGTNIAWVNNSTIAGWHSTRTTYNSGTGSSNAGALYSFGVAGIGPLSDRALGGVGSGGTGTFYWAGCFINNTGTALTASDIAYVGEQWRDGLPAPPAAQSITFEYQIAATGVVTGANTPTTGWTAFPSLNFTGPIAGTGPAAVALDGNAVANRVALAANLAVAVPVGQEIWMRWVDINDASNDHGLAIDDFSITPKGSVGPTPSLSINDVAVTEGNAGPTLASFTVSLSVAAPAGGVTFDIATADNTATTANNDYVSRTLTAQTIPAGSSTFAFDVTVNGDTTVEANETFFVNVSNVIGANVGDAQGQGTISNDDVMLTAIHDIQGPGSASPIVGASVTTRGVVTGRKSNGFFMQEPDASVDANPLTSEGVFVFTSAAPPAAAAVGNLVQVTATVVEFVPASDPLQPPLTELSSPAVTLVTAAVGLPTATALTTSLPSPAGAFDQLERLEGMLVSVASLTINAPSEGNTNEVNATGTNNGVFYGYVTGLNRVLRESGIQPPDPTPAGTIPPIPRWDGNPELLRVDSDGLPGTTALQVGFGQAVTGLIGPLDYGFRHYTILPAVGSTPTATGAATTIAVSAPLPSEVTIASYNLERFFDDVNDPAIGEPVLTALAYQNRLNKASLGIRNALQTPDIVGIIEIENLTTLQALATKINNDAVAASQPNPLYTAYLIEGNDVGGIDVGFLVKTAPVVGTTARVVVNAVVQELDATLFTNPDTTTATLNDRPPLRLDALVNNASGQSYPLTVIVNHLRSLSGSSDPAAGVNGWATEGERVRAKRQEQAVDLANLVQTRQTNNPNEQIVLVGDFNAFEFNDGLGDSMNTITGTPTPDNQTAVTGDGADLVNPDLDNLFDSVPANERYSFSFDGSAQSLDHALVNAAVLAQTTAPRIEHARINADFAEIERNNAATPNRLSDHDPLLVYLQPNGFVPLDVSITKTATPSPVTAGNNLSYTLTVANAGPQPALNTSWSDILPTGTSFVSLSAVAGWTCTQPAVGATGTVSCSNPSVAIGSAVFTLVVSVDAAVASGSVINNTATVSTSSPDSNAANNSATATTSVDALTDLSITLTDSPDPVTAGTNLTYVATISNAGPSAATGVTATLTLPANTTLVSGTVAGGGSCAGAPVVCTYTGPLLVGAPRAATITVAVAPAAANGSTLTASVVAASATAESNSANNTASTTTLVSADANLALTFTTSATQTLINVPVTFTASSQNLGPSDAQNLLITVTLSPDFRYSSYTASAGAVCTTPQVGLSGAISCTWAGATAVGATRTLEVTAYSFTAGTSSIQASTSSDTSDPVFANNLASQAVQVGNLVENIPTLDRFGLILMGLLFGLAGLLSVRRQD